MRKVIQYNNLILRFIREFYYEIPIEVYLKLVVVENKNLTIKEIRKKLHETWTSEDFQMRYKEELKDQQAKKTVIDYYQPSDDNKINRLKKRADSIQSILFVIGVKEFIEIVLKKYHYPQQAGLPYAEWNSQSIRRYIGIYFNIKMGMQDKASPKRITIKQYLKRSVVFKNIKRVDSEYGLVRNYLDNSKRYHFILVLFVEKQHPEEKYEKIYYRSYYDINSGQIKKHLAWLQYSYTEQEENNLGGYLYEIDKWLKKSEIIDDRQRPVLIIRDDKSFKKIRDNFYPTAGFYLGQSFFLWD